MTRAPVFRVKDTRHAVEAAEWVEHNIQLLSDEVSKTTAHGKLISAKPFSAGRSLFIRFSYSTGDAMGMNMATIATEALSKKICEHTGAVLISVSGNMCVDKKPSAMDLIEGRGKMVLADVLLSKDIVEKKLHTTPQAASEACYRKNQIGSSLAAVYGANAHVANMLAAIYIATGQDPAQVVEGSMATTTCEQVDDGLYVSLRLPCVEVGSVGGGTKLPCQKEALSMIGCAGPGGSKKLAEIVGAVALAGEISTIAAQSAGQLGSAHAALGR